MPWKTRTFIEVPHDARRRIERAIAALEVMLEQLDGDEDFEPDLDLEARPGKAGESKRQLEFSL
jgi:hypothetical protein